MRLLLLLLVLSYGTALTFPRPNSERHAFIVCSSAGNLPSAANDAITHAVVWARLGFTLHHYLDVTPPQLTRIADRLRQHQLKTTIHSIEAFQNDLLALTSLHYPIAPIDVIVALSSHGYRGNGHNYILFGGQQITDTQLRSWFMPLTAYSHIRVVAFVDTCHSGSMLGFTKTQATTICSISACNNAESDMDDISTEFGFSGGLTAAVMDTLGNAESFDVGALYTSCRQRLAAFGTHPQLTGL